MKHYDKVITEGSNDKVYGIVNLYDEIKRFYKEKPDDPIIKLMYEDSRKWYQIICNDVRKRMNIKNYIHLLPSKLLKGKYNVIIFDFICGDDMFFPIFEDKNGYYINTLDKKK